MWKIILKQAAFLQLKQFGQNPVRWPGYPAQIENNSVAVETIKVQFVNGRKNLSRSEKNTAVV